jgi:hypothetical protein
MTKNNIIYHKTFIDDINKQISNLRNWPAEESYSRLVYIAKQLIDYKKETWINIF